MKEIYLGGGCFWGMEAYFSNVKGVEETKVGYGNSNIENPTYENVCSGNTNAVEVVYIKYNEEKISLEKILFHFFQNIDSTTLNRQGNDIGTQYRSGIYYVDEKDKEIIEKYILEEERKKDIQIVTEVIKLKNFYLGEEYHQKYLMKNPKGYCHNYKAIESLKNTEDYKK